MQAAANALVAAAATADVAAATCAGIVAANSSATVPCMLHITAGAVLPSRRVAARQRYCKRKKQRHQQRQHLVGVSMHHPCRSDPRTADNADNADNAANTATGPLLSQDTR